jgi:manganese transport protein
VTTLDVSVALGVAGIVNAAILLGATSLRGSDVTSLAGALGQFTAVAFAVALLASGLAASSVGVYSGQVVMQGFVRRSIPLSVRRLVSVMPVLVVLMLGVDETKTLVASQVALSFGVPFAIFPLLMFTSDRALMGEFANRRVTSVLAWVAAALIVVLNGYLVAVVL